MSKSPESARAKAGQACAAKLEAAAAALNAYRYACNACDDASGDKMRGIADGRTMLMRDICEYAGYLDSLYNR